MIPVNIQDYIKNITNDSVSPEKRQFYYDTLVRIKTEIDKSIAKYELERKFKRK